MSQDTLHARTSATVHKHTPVSPHLPPPKCSFGRFVEQKLGPARIFASAPLAPGTTQAGRSWWLAFIERACVHFVYL